MKRKQSPLCFLGEFALMTISWGICSGFVSLEPDLQTRQFPNFGLRWMQVLPCVFRLASHNMASHDET